MGYYSRFGGDITVTTEGTTTRLPAELVEAHRRDNTVTRPDSECVALRVKAREATGIIEGIETSVTILEIVGMTCGIEDEVKCYNFADDLKAEAEWLLGLNPDIKFSGFIEREGEENGDMERYFVNPDGSVATQKPEIVWPEPQATGEGGN